MRRARKGNSHAKDALNKKENIEIINRTDENIEDEDIKIYKKGKVVDESEVKTTVSVSQKEKNKKQKINKYVIIFTVSLVVMIFASVLGMFLGGMFGGGNFAGLSGGKGNSNYIQPIDKATGRVNVLILGVDKEGLRTDTIIIASYDVDEKTVDVLSIPRDTRMYIGTKYQKINSAHAITQNGKIKGPQGTIEAVTRLTGIPINYYVEFNFEAFRKTIDELGGVYFNVPQTMKYKDKTQDLYINLAPGYQKLDGDKAEQLVRFRQYPEGDIKRVRVQQEFMMALAEQKLNAKIIPKIPELFGTVICKYVKTNLKLNDVAKYSETLSDLDIENIQMHELPGEYSGSDWKPNMEEIKVIAETYFECDASKITDGKPGSVAINNTKKPSSTNLTTKEPSTSEEDDDEKETKEPTSSPKQTKTPSNTETPKATNNATKRPAVSVEPTKKPTQTKTPQSTTSVPTKAPQETTEPTVKPTEEPKSTPNVSLNKPNQRPSQVVEVE